MAGDVAAHLLEVFREFDTDGNGRIDATELRTMMERVGLPMTRDEAAEVLEEMDEICQGLLATASQGGSETASKFEDFEDDGEVSFEEFYAVLMKLEGARAYTANSLGATATGGSGNIKLTIRAIAGTIDQLRARTEQKKRWRAKEASSQTLQDVRTDKPVSKLDEDRREAIEGLLANVPLLATLAPPAKAQLLDLLAFRRYSKGQDIVRRGDEGNEFFLILKGRVQVLSETEDVIVELGQGQHFGERSLIISEPRNATVRCAVECEVASMHRVGFTQILDKIGAKERERRRRLAQRKQMEEKRKQREKERAERARAREQAGRKRPKGRLRRFSAIDDWSAAMEETEAQEGARETNDTPGQALAGVKRRVRRASVEMFAKVKETISATSSSASPRVRAGSTNESASSEDEFDTMPGSSDGGSPRAPSTIAEAPAEGDGDKSSSGRALAGVRRRVRRASVTMVTGLVKIKHTISNSLQKESAQKEDFSEEEEERDLPPAKDLLKATMAELDALLGEQAERHESAQRGWDRALAARKPVVDGPSTTRASHSRRRSSSGLSTLPILEKTASVRSQDTPVPLLAATRRRRGGVGAAGQTLVMGTIGVPRALDGATAATLRQASKRKAGSARALPALELRDPERDRRVRAARFRSDRASKALNVAPRSQDAAAVSSIRYPWTSSRDEAEIDEWLGEIEQ
jgi:CRP-like cAMP-binding protein